MASYWRPVDSRAWGDRRFKMLSPDGKLVFLYLLTCPASDIPGLVPRGPAAIAEDTGLERETVLETFREMVFGDAALALLDATAGLVLLPNALSYRPPDNPNVLKGWLKEFDRIPESHLKDEWVQRLREHAAARGGGFNEVSAVFADTQGELFTKPPGNSDSDFDFDSDSSSKPRSSSPAKKLAAGVAAQVAEYLNEAKKTVTGRRGTFEPDTPGLVRVIRLRMENEGATLEDFKLVVAYKARAWTKDQKTKARMWRYFRPSTLFSEEHFAEYREEARDADTAGQLDVAATLGAASRADLEAAKLELEATGGLL